MASLRSQFVMTSRPPNTDILPPSSSELLNIVTRFSAELGTMTDLTTLGNRIIQELCRAGATTHGTLFLLDREHECYRRASMVGPVAPTLMPPTLAMSHPLPHHLLTTNRIMTQADSAVDLQETDSGAGARAAMEAMQVTRVVPHLIKGRLIAFSLLGAAHTCRWRKCADQIHARRTGTNRHKCAGHHCAVRGSPSLAHAHETHGSAEIP